MPSQTSVVPNKVFMHTEEMDRETYRYSNRERERSRLHIMLAKFDCFRLLPGHLEVSMHPCTPQGVILSDENDELFVDDPKELLGKRVDYLLKVCMEACRCICWRSLLQFCLFSSYCTFVWEDFLRAWTAAQVQQERVLQVSVL